MSFLTLVSSLLPYLAATLVASLVAVVLLAGYRQVPGRWHLGVLMIFVAFWAFFNFLEDATNLWPVKLAYANLQYLAIAAVPVLFLRFATQISQGAVPRWTEAPWFRVVSVVFPALLAAAVWFDPEWGFVRRDLKLLSNGPLTVIGKTYGPGFWILLAYGYTLVALGLGLWGRFLFQKGRFRNPGSVVPFLSAFFPWVASILVALGLNPWEGHDPTTPAFALTGLILLVSHESNRALNLLPAAREVVMDAWPSPLLIFDLRGALLFYNPPAAQAWGLVPEHRGQPRRTVLPWLPAASGRSETRTVEDLGTGTVWEVVERPLTVRGRRKGEMVVCHDISALEVKVAERTVALEEAYSRLSDELVHRRRTEEQLFYFSLHDSMTGLANRSLFLSRVDQALGRMRRHPEAGFAVLLLNLSGFKKVNDLHGHEAGDHFLIQVAQRLRQTLRSVDTAARSGSDSFLVLLDGVVTAEALREAADRIRGELEAPLEVRGSPLIPAVRIGMVLADPRTKAPEALLADGEQALERTKDESSGTTVLFAPEWRQDRHARFLLKEDLAKALVQGELSLVYQPIVSLVTGRLDGLETLARWSHPTLGPIAPSQFITMAEHEGIIQPLGLWVLRETARFFASLADLEPETADLFLSVNVSPRQLTAPDFTPIVLGLLERERFDPGRLHLEVTETALVENSEVLVPILAGLRREGIRIKLDDFGTGYSSLHSLHRLPLDTLKVDRSFVTELPQGKPIIRTIVRLAEDLGLDVVAEGVETTQQRDWLQELGCGEGQGYWFAPGLTPQEVADRLGAGLEAFLDPREAPA